MLHNVDNCFDIENILYMHNQLMGLSLKYNPILLFQEVNSLNIQETLNKGQFFYKECSVINGNMFFTDKNMYNIYSGDTSRYGSKKDNKYTDIEEKFKQYIKDNSSIINFYDLMKELHDKPKSVSILNDFSKFASEVDMNDTTEIGMKFISIAKTINKIKAMSNDKYKLKYLRRLLIHHCRNTAKSVTNRYYGDIRYNDKGELLSSKDQNKLKIEHFI